MRIAAISAILTEVSESIKLTAECLAKQSLQTDYFVVSNQRLEGVYEAGLVINISIDDLENDNFNIGRAVGALLAIARDYDAIVFVDPGEYLEKNQIYMRMKEILQYPMADLFVFESDDIESVPLKLSQLLFLPGSFHIIPNIFLLRAVANESVSRFILELLRKDNLAITQIVN